VSLQGERGNARAGSAAWDLRLERQIAPVDPTSALRSKPWSSDPATRLVVMDPGA